MHDRKDGDVERPLSARSVLASTLLGLDPPVLPTARLVATAGLFGISEGAARVALSRMASAGEVVAESGAYRLTGPLLERQARQTSGRRPPRRRWSGRWRTAVVVVAERRSPAERAGLRAAMAGARMAELREGVWLRPDNLDTALPAPVSAQCRLLSAEVDGGGDRGLAAELWDLGAWAGRAEELERRVLAGVDALAADPEGSLAPGFVLSAAVLRHLAADPLLPPELLAPAWPGDHLRRTYDAYDRAYRRALADWHATSGSAPG